MAYLNDILYHCTMSTENDTLGTVQKMNQIPCAVPAPGSGSGFGRKGGGWGEGEEGGGKQSSDDDATGPSPAYKSAAILHGFCAAATPQRSSRV